MTYGAYQRFSYVPRLISKFDQITVAVKIICLASVKVFLMAKAKAIAPRSPDKNNICWRFQVILLRRPKFNKNDNGYILIALPTMIATNAPAIKATSKLC